MLQVTDLGKSASDIGNKALQKITTTTTKVTEKVIDVPDTVKETVQEVKSSSKNIIAGLSENRTMLTGIMLVSAFGIGYLIFKK